MHEIVRVRTALPQSLAIERSYFPNGPFPDHLDRGLPGSLYTVLARDYRLRPTSTAESLEPVIAHQEEARLLEVKVGAPLTLITQTAHTVAGLAVEFARDIFRPHCIRAARQIGIGRGTEPPIPKSPSLSCAPAEAESQLKLTGAPSFRFP